MLKCDFFSILATGFAIMFEEGISVNTTQNVLISYQPAGVGDRILASLLDGIFKGGYILICFIILGAMGANDVDGMTIFAIVSIMSLPYMFYSIAMEQFNNGQSLGKKIMRIRVVKLDGSQPSFGAYLIRWVMRIIDMLLFNGLVALLTVAFSKNSQRLGDMAAGTTVVSLKQKVSLKNTILYKTAPDYKIVFHEVNKLSDKDVGIIKEVFDYCSANGDKVGMRQLAVKVKAKMGVITELSDQAFLKVVLMDYSQYQFEK